MLKNTVAGKKKKLAGISCSLSKKNVFLQPKIKAKK